MKQIDGRGLRKLLGKSKVVRSKRSLIVNQMTFFNCYMHQFKCRTNAKDRTANKVIKKAGEKTAAAKLLEEDAINLDDVLKKSTGSRQLLGRKGNSHGTRRRRISIRVAKKAAEIRAKMKGRSLAANRAAAEKMAKTKNGTNARAISQERKAKVVFQKLRSAIRRMSQCMQEYFKKHPRRFGVAGC